MGSREGESQKQIQADTKVRAGSDNSKEFAHASLKLLKEKYRQEYLENEYLKVYRQAKT